MCEREWVTGRGRSHKATLGGLHVAPWLHFIHWIYTNGDFELLSSMLFCFEYLLELRKATFVGYSCQYPIYGVFVHRVCKNTYVVSLSHHDHCLFDGALWFQWELKYFKKTVWCPVRYGESPKILSYRGNYKWCRRYQSSFLISSCIAVTDFLQTSQSAPTSFN